MIFLFNVEQAKVIDQRECTWNAMEYCRTLKKPRSIKSHLPFEFLPKQIVDGTKKPRVKISICVYNDLNFSFLDHLHNKTSDGRMRFLLLSMCKLRILSRQL